LAKGRQLRPFCSDLCSCGLGVHCGLVIRMARITARP
jgi:hypothetical protein